MQIIPITGSLLIILVFWGLIVYGAVLLLRYLSRMADAQEAIVQRLDAIDESLRRQG